MVTLYQLAYFFAVAACLLQFVADSRLNRTNSEFLDFLGLKPRQAVWHRLCRGLECLVLLSLLRAAFLGEPLAAGVGVAALGFVSCGLILRVFSQKALGRVWARGWVNPDSLERVDSGPYRYLRHPEYVGRFLEMLGLLTLTGSVALIIALAVTYAGLLVCLSRWEERQGLLAPSLGD